MVLQAGVNALLHLKNLPLLVKSAVQGKLAHSLYLECKRIAENKNNWQSNYLRRNFIAGTNRTNQ